jgi:hypothetical protein
MTYPIEINIKKDIPTGSSISGCGSLYELPEIARSSLMFEIKKPAYLKEQKNKAVVMLNIKKVFFYCSFHEQDEKKSAAIIQKSSSGYRGLTIRKI